MFDWPIWLAATFWGGITGSSLLIGAFIGFKFNLKARVVAGIMAFGSGVLISALSFELMEEAFKRSGFTEVVFGFLLGGIIYTVANYALSKAGGKHRKRSGMKNLNDQQDSSLGIALGALIDGIPESLIIGIGLIEGSSLSMATIIAIFISNIPEALSSTAGMKEKGKKAGYIFSIWGGICLFSAIFAGLGNLLFTGASASTLAVIMALAAGGILAMIVDTMIPEAFAETHDFAGLITLLGFLTAFILERI
ncbi:MAG: ZIP family zinc transporter [Fusobacteria bacterium]|nr:ZIP family zinc transporter [Fusobacteriota bacterium]